MTTKCAICVENCRERASVGDFCAPMTDDLRRRASKFFGNSYVDDAIKHHLAHAHTFIDGECDHGHAE